MQEDLLRKFCASDKIKNRVNLTGQCLQPGPEHSQPTGRAGDGRGRIAGRSPESLRAASWRPRTDLSRKGGVPLKLVNAASDLAQRSGVGFLLLLITVVIIVVNIIIVPVFCVSS